MNLVPVTLIESNIIIVFAGRRCHHQFYNTVNFNKKYSDKYRFKQQSLASILTVNNSSSLNSLLVNDLTCNFVFLRNISLSTLRYEKEPLKPSSKVEVTVKALKDEQKNKELLPVEKPVVKKSLKDKIVHELVHYYHGFRLLFIDIKISAGLVWRILNGKTLSRREHNLLIRTVGDLFRLVPFSVFIIVPFMELALPIFIKLFPGLLPSTFQTSKEREDKLKQNLKVKLEMAKFLQKTLDDMAVQHKDRFSNSAKEFSEWFHKIRTSGEQVSNEDIMRFSKLFQDEITLDSLSRAQLVALCRVLEVQTLGMNNLLKFQLRMKLRNLAADDKLIQKEGVDSLTVLELQNACKARGMRAYGLSAEMLRRQLSQWLDLSLNKKVPPSLLLLSRALMLPDTIPTTDKLKATISVLPDTILTQTSAAIAETEGKTDNKMKLEVIQEEARKVKEERQELREERKRKEQEDKEILVDKAPVLDAEKVMEFAEPIPVEIKKKEQISTSDLEVLEDALDALAKNKLILEKESIEDLKEEMADYQEDLQELQEVTASTARPRIRETKAAKRLYKRVNKMINRMDSVVAELEDKEKILKKELAGGESKVTTEDIVKIDELLDSVKKMQKIPDKFVLHQIQTMLSKMDDDHDGSIKVEDVLKVRNVYLFLKYVLLI